jgi:hypothetical protein
MHLAAGIAAAVAASCLVLWLALTLADRRLRGPRLDAAIGVASAVTYVSAAVGVALEGAPAFRDFGRRADPLPCAVLLAVPICLYLAGLTLAIARRRRPQPRHAGDREPPPPPTA